MRLFYDSQTLSLSHPHPHTQICSHFIQVRLSVSIIIVLNVIDFLRFKWLFLRAMQVQSSTIRAALVDSLGCCRWADCHCVEDVLGISVTLEPLRVLKCHFGRRFVGVEGFICCWFIAVGGSVHCFRWLWPAFEWKHDSLLLTRTSLLIIISFVSLW